MPNQSDSLTPARLVQLFSRHRTLLIAPAIAGAVVAAFSTLVLPRDWEAEQGLLIRSDAAGYADQRLGKFTDLSEMKTVQETVLELARSQSVVTSVLEEVTGREPSRRQIADFRDKLRLTPPGGAEFGKTEVFYIGVLDPDRDRAIAKVESLTGQLDQRLTKLRADRADSMVAEVERSVAIARDQLHAHVQKLARFEQSVGADLIELRHLTSPNGGQSERTQKVLAIEAERRRLVDQRRQNEALLAELEAAQADPARLLAAPDALLTSQPSLRRLKNGAVEAQLTTTRLAGIRTANHPYMKAARRAQRAVQDELARAIPAAIAGVKLELRVAQNRESEFTEQLADLQRRSVNLAGQRSEYAELVANVEGQTSVLEGALKQLADAKSHRAGATTSSLLARIDAVETGVNPAGPGRTTVTAAGGLAGLLLGATLVFVFFAPSNESAHAAFTPKTAAPAAAAATAPVATPVAQPQTHPVVQPVPAAASVSADSLWGIELAKQSTTGRQAAAIDPFATTTASTASTTPIGV